MKLREFLRRSLFENAALKAFKRGLEALIRHDFPACIGFLQRGIALNKQNAPLNQDMTQLIDRVRDGATAVGKPCGMVMGTPEQARFWRDRGYPLLLIPDPSFLVKQHLRWFLDEMARP